jgi:hypothetical protein
LLADGVALQVKAVGLNFADIFACQVHYNWLELDNQDVNCCVQGLYSATPKGEFTPGLEFAGEVVEIGEKNSSSVLPALKVGDRVMGVNIISELQTKVKKRIMFICLTGHKIRRILHLHPSLEPTRAPPASRLVLRTGCCIPLHSYDGLVNMPSLIKFRRLR